MSTSNGLSLNEVTIGMTESYSQTITDADVKTFAGLSGDNNPVHMSEEFASNSKFGRRIAHGLISASFFSALFGTKLPGPGCVYVSQDLTFRKPVYLGDTVTAIIKVTSIDAVRNRLFFSTQCLVKGKIVISGTAEIFVPPITER